MIPDYLWQLVRISHGHVLDSFGKTSGANQRVDNVSVRRFDS